MWLQFLLENAHFAINLFFALVLFAVFWLYYDAWTQRKHAKDVIKLAGYFFLSVSFVVQAIYIESSILTTSFINASVQTWALASLRIAGFVCIIIGLLTERIEPTPTRQAGTAPQSLALLPVVAVPVIIWPSLLYPILAAVIALLYLRRATVGLEDHLKPVAWSFYLLAIGEFIAMAALFRQSDNVTVYQLVAPFGPFWIAEHAFYLFSACIFGRWVFGYLLKQFETQMFMIFTVTTLIIFLITTVSFTGLLLKNMQDETLRQLGTDVNVLDFSIKSKKSELLSDASVIAQNPQVVAAVGSGTRNDLTTIAQTFLLTKKESSLIITSDAGQVLMRGEDKDRAGDSLSDNPLIRRALLGGATASVVTKDGVLAPEISVQAATPIQDQGKVIGTVLVGSVIDNAFVDGLKVTTGLESSIYGNNQVSASTLTSPDGKSRLIGIKEENAAIKSTVLGQGESYSGSVTLLQTPYFGAYVPLTNVDNNPVGMLFVGRPQYSVIAAAGKSIELTFVITALLLVLSVIPSYFIAKYITSQL